MAKKRLDGFANAITGLGTSRDRLARASIYSMRNSWHRQDTLETLYYEEDMCARIVDAIVDDGMRQGFDLDREATEDEGGEQAIGKRMRILDAANSVSQAAKWGRLYGGGAVLLVMDDGDHGRPLAMGRKLVALSVLDRWEMVPVSYYTDPMLPSFGEVETWRVQRRSSATTESVVVHESRLVRFDGIQVSRIERSRQNGWTLSVLTRAYEVVRDGSQNWRSVSNILSQSTQPIFKIKDLASMIANGEDDTLTRRMAAANLTRSALNAVLIDAEGEEFRFESASLGGLDVILDKTWQRLAAAADMPVTRLMGVSPAGLNATGESDTRGWYDRVQSYRETVLGPALECIAHVIAAELGDQSPTEWVIRWPSLWQMSPTEEAAYRKSIADTDSVYIDKQVLLPEEVGLTRFGSGQYSDAAVTIDPELRARAAEPATVPDATPPATPTPETVE